jgi:Icc-related predicted phosphoesterase
MGKDLIRIVVSTDLHYLAPELQDGGKAFQNMMKMADGRITDRSADLFAAFTDRMKELHPDALILTGDMTFNGEKTSHRQVAGRLHRLRQAGIPVLVIPGNHDLENPLAGSYLGDEGEPAEAITKDDYQKLYGDLMLPDAYTSQQNPESDAMVISRYPSSFGYVCALSDSLWVLAVDVNGNTYPGEVSRGILAWAEGQLCRAKEQSITVIGISHQNLFSHNALFGPQYRMIGAEHLKELYQKYKVKLHLSGHTHVQHTLTEDGVTEIVTSSLSLGSCSYGVLEIHPAEQTAEYHTEMLEAFAKGARETFLQNGKEKTLMEMSEQRMDEKTATLLAEDLARLNLAYFEGRVDLCRDRENIREEWKKEAPQSFWNQYIAGILDEEIRDQTVCRVSLGDPNAGHDPD